MYKVNLKKASQLFTQRISTTTIISEFKNNEFPLFYNSYHPGKAFVAVPPALLIELAKLSGNEQLAEVVSQAVADINQENITLRTKLSEKYKERTQIAHEQTPPQE